MEMTPIREAEKHFRYNFSNETKKTISTETMRIKDKCI